MFGINGKLGGAAKSGTNAGGAAGTAEASISMPALLAPPTAETDAAVVACCASSTAAATAAEVAFSIKAALDMAVGKSAPPPAASMPDVIAGDKSGEAPNESTKRNEPAGFRSRAARCRASLQRWRRPHFPRKGWVCCKRKYQRFKIRKAIRLDLTKIAYVAIVGVLKETSCNTTLQTRISCRRKRVNPVQPVVCAKIIFRLCEISGLLS